MGIDVHATIDRSAIVRQAVRSAVASVVVKSAMDVEAHAKDLAPVDTGNLRASIQADVSQAESDLTAVVAVGAEYGQHVEYGTTRQKAQPYMTPAAEAVLPVFPRAVASAVEGALNGR